MTLPISTKRCVLRLATPEDYDALLAGVSAPAFPPELPLAKLYRQQKLNAWLDTNVALATSKRACLLSVDLLGGEPCIGQVSLSHIDDSPHWNLAFWLHPAHWGRGLASEAALAAVAYGFTTLGIPEIRAGAARWNVRSMKTLRQIGLLPLPSADAYPTTPGTKAPFLSFSASCETWLRNFSDRQ